MITIETGCTKALSCYVDSIKSIAYDGCDYALLRHNRIGITRLNNEFCSLGTSKPPLHYMCICFDRKRCCYYACASEYPYFVFELDLNFHQIHQLSFTNEQGECPYVISMQPNSSILMMLFQDKLLSVHLETGEVVHSVQLDPNKQVLDLIALCDGFILAYLEEGIMYLEVYCSSDGMTKRYEIPSCYQLNAMILVEVSYEDCACCYELALLLTKYDTQEQYCSQLFVTCAKNQPTPCPPVTVTCQDGKYEIIHSIALEEAGIAHILNAEGEKLQKAVASDITIEELLMVNESVRKTISQITILEGQLYSKLESLHCLCIDEVCEEE